MVYSSMKSLRWATVWTRIEKPLTAGLLAIGLGAIFATSMTKTAEASEVAFSVAQVPVSDTVDNSSAASTVPFFEDGTYLYGQSPEPEQIGSAYMVFEVQANQVVGAFYMPHSSFDCFYGDVERDRLALTVVDSYEQTHHDYAVNIDHTDVAAGNPAITPVSLEGFHAIDGLSETDQRVLGICQSEYGQEI